MIIIMTQIPQIIAIISSHPSIPPTPSLSVTSLTSPTSPRSWRPQSAQHRIQWFDEKMTRLTKFCKKKTRSVSNINGLWWPWISLNPYIGYSHHLSTVYSLQRNQPKGVPSLRRRNCAILRTSKPCAFAKLWSPSGAAEVWDMSNMWMCIGI